MSIQKQQNKSKLLSSLKTISTEIYRLQPVATIVKTLVQQSTVSDTLIISLNLHFISIDLTTLSLGFSKINAHRLIEKAILKIPESY